MNNRSKYYYKLDIIRIVSCIGVLLYHLGILKGGYLAVCTFFVLSGYLSYLSLINKEQLSLKDYYLSKFKKIYLPLIIVVFITICITSFFNNIYWFNLKPETTSVLLFYNNYWQLGAQTDYFANYGTSPFIHFWYIAILLQFDIIFPFIYLVINKLKKHLGKLLPLLLLLILFLASIIYFYYIGKDDITRSYYLFSTRVHSLLLGVIFGYMKSEYNFNSTIEIPNISSIIFYEYFIAFVLLLFIGDVNNSYLFFMFMSLFISIQMIRFGSIYESKDESIIIKKIASITYEIYLIQYPLIFIFNYISINTYIKFILIIIIDILLSIILKYALSNKQDNKDYRLPIQIFLSILVIYGIYQYVITKDYTNEINQLRTQLTINEDLVIKRQKEYSYKQQEEKEAWDKILNDFNSSEKQISNTVSNLSIVGIGDSVMLGAIPSLYEVFPNGYFDAKVSRTDYEANRILQDIKNRGQLSDNIVINLGTNGQCGTPCQEEIIATCENRNIYWVNVTNDWEVHVNGGLNDLARRHSNVHIIDWNSISKGHNEYFISDGIHLTGIGMKEYSNAIYKAIYERYYNDFLDKKNKILEEHDLSLKKKISFFGNNTLLNIYNNLNSEYIDSSFDIKNNYSYDEVLLSIKEKIQNNELNYNIVISIDSSDGISLDDYLKLISLLDNHEIYIIFTYNKPYSFNNDKVHVIDFYTLLNNNPDYWMVDHKHFSDTGNSILIELINNNFKEKKEALSKGAFLLITCI